MSTDEVINLITKKLYDMDGVSLEDIANKLLDKTVNYEGDSVFSVN
jgi:hypothetical protein